MKLKQALAYFYLYLALAFHGPKNKKNERVISWNRKFVDYTSINILKDSFKFRTQKEHSVLNLCRKINSQLFVDNLRAGIVHFKILTIITRFRTNEKVQCNPVIVEVRSKEMATKEKFQIIWKSMGFNYGLKWLHNVIYFSDY